MTRRAGDSIEKHPDAGFASLALIFLAVVVLFGAACGSSTDDDAGSGAASSATTSAPPPPPAGPSPAERSSTVAALERRVAEVRAGLANLRERVEIAGLGDDALLDRRMSTADGQLDGAVNAVAGLKEAAGEAWSAAKTQTERSVSALESGIRQVQDELRERAAAQREQHIEQIRPLLAQGLVEGLSDHVYLAYRSSVVKDVQRRLSELGLYDGPVDGYLEKSTQRALAHFQKQNGIWATGVPTPRTRRALELEGSG